MVGIKLAAEGAVSPDWKEAKDRIEVAASHKDRGCLTSLGLRQ